MWDVEAANNHGTTTPDNHDTKLTVIPAKAGNHIPENFILTTEIK
jgi:hypothetical protein